MSKKGKKNLRGRPEKWDELKRPVNITLTPTGVSGLDALAASLGLCRSELVDKDRAWGYPHLPRRSRKTGTS